MKHYSKASPLTHLTEKEVAFQWSDECESAFQTLKQNNTLNAIMTIPCINF